MKTLDGWRSVIKPQCIADYRANRDYVPKRRGGAKRLPKNALSAIERQALVAGVTPLCESKATQYARGSTLALRRQDREELLAAMFEAVCYAATVWQPNCAAKFSSYAFHWIRGAITAHRQYRDRPCGFRWHKLPKTPRTLSFGIEMAGVPLGELLGDEPAPYFDAQDYLRHLRGRQAEAASLFVAGCSRSEIAHRMGCGTANVGQLLRDAFLTIRLAIQEEVR